MAVIILKNDFNFLLTIYCLFSLSTQVNSQNWLIESFIPPDYDKSQPPLVNGYVPVDNSVVINRFSAARDQRVQYTLLYRMIHLIVISFCSL